MSLLPQELKKQQLSKKEIYDSMIINPVTCRFSPNEERSNLNVCDELIITVGGKCFCLGVLSTYYLYSS